MPTRKKFVAGNWKMNTTHDSAVALAKAVADRRWRDARW